MTCQLLLKTAALLSGGAALLSARARRPWLTTSLVLLASVLVGIYLLSRWLLYWPYTPIYTTPHQVAFLLGIIFFLHVVTRGWDPRKHGLFVAVAMLCLTFTGAFFPKDYYLPNLKTASLWAHLFSWFDALARALFLGASAEAASIFSCQAPLPPKTFSHLGPWGMVAMATAATSGAMWSIQAIGRPISFYHIHTLGFLTIWFYWLFICHLAWWKISWLAYWKLMVIGGLLTLFVTIHTCMGIWRPL